MNRLPDFFGITFVINLPERVDRLRWIKKEIARVGWDLGSEGIQLFPACRFADRANFPSAAIRGCFHSHLECLRQAHSQGRRSVLILEDDVTFAPSLPRLTRSILSQLESAEWDLVYFSHEKTGDDSIANWGTREHDIKLEDWTTRHILTGYFYGVHGRILPRLIEHLNRIKNSAEGDPVMGPMTYDGALNVFRTINGDVKTLITRPKLGRQRPFRSDITPRSFDNVLLLRPFTAALRDLKHLAQSWRS
jgi:glycosyl transferase, family 25